MNFLPTDDPTRRDSVVSDVDSASGDESLHSETVRYIEENGRIYHAPWAGDRYLLPNDDREQKRLDTLHEILLATDDLHKSTLPDNIQKVLDVGTGTGIWANAFADTYPSARVTGLDLSPNQMTTSVHDHCCLYAEDVGDGHGLGHDFDYVHVRFLHGIYHRPNFITNVFKALAPGGIIEIRDLEFPPQFHDEDGANASAIKDWSKNVIKGAAKIGHDLTSLNKIPEILEAAGFENFERHILTWPMGIWPEERELRMLGQQLEEPFDELREAFALRALSELGWDLDKTMRLLADAKAEIQHGARVSMYVRTFWARKPTPTS